MAAAVVGPWNSAFDASEVEVGEKELDNGDEDEGGMEGVLMAAEFIVVLFSGLGMGVVVVIVCVALDKMTVGEGDGEGFELLA